MVTNMKMINLYKIYDIYIHYNIYYLFNLLIIINGPCWDSNPGPLGPEPRIIASRLHDHND